MACGTHLFSLSANLMKSIKHMALLTYRFSYYIVMTITRLFADQRTRAWLKLLETMSYIIIITVCVRIACALYAVKPIIMRQRLHSFSSSFIIRLEK